MTKDTAEMCSKFYIPQCLRDERKYTCNKTEECYVGLHIKQQSFSAKRIHSQKEPSNHKTSSRIKCFNKEAWYKDGAANIM